MSDTMLLQVAPHLQCRAKSRTVEFVPCARAKRFYPILFVDASFVVLWGGRVASSVLCNPGCCEFKSTFFHLARISADRC